MTSNDGSQMSRIATRSFSVLNWSSVSTTRIIELVVDCVVALSATAANVIWLSSGAGLLAAIAVPPVELCTMPCSNCSVGFLVRRSNLRWLCVCTTSLSTCVCALKSRRLDPACSQHVMLLLGPPHLIRCSRAMHYLSLICSFSSCRGDVFLSSPFISVNGFLSQR